MIMVAVIGLMNDCGFMVAAHDDCGVVVVIVGIVLVVMVIG